MNSGLIVPKLQIERRLSAHREIGGDRVISPRVLGITEALRKFKESFSFCYVLRCCARAFDRNDGIRLERDAQKS